MINRDELVGVLAGAGYRADGIVRETARLMGLVLQGSDLPTRTQLRDLEKRVSDLTSTFGLAYELISAAAPQSSGSVVASDNPVAQSGAAADVSKTKRKKGSKTHGNT